MGKTKTPRQAKVRRKSLQMAQLSRGQAVSHRIKVCRWGNSLALRIPAEAARKLNLHEGTTVLAETDEGTMRLAPDPAACGTEHLRPPIPTLNELLKGVTPKKVGGEVDWGKPKGKEIW